jgi:multidrug efflux pump subunit AcrA (membrane-fusion protein)
MGVEKDNVTTFEVRVSIQNPGGELKAEMTANAEIILEEHKNVLQIPEGAILYDKDKKASVEIPNPKGKDGKDKIAVLLGAGAKGKRFALPHVRVLLHQPWGGVGGQASDIEIQAREILRMKDMLNDMLAQDTGQSVARITKDTDRDFIISAAEAVEYGLIDEVITARP